VGAEKLSRTTGLSKSDSQKLLDAYWQRNWAVKKVAEQARIRKIRGQMWVLNPVNKFWYSLRYKKDAWSTLNQGTGSYCFDIWTAFCRSRGYKINMQYHDEGCYHVEKGGQEKAERDLRWAVGRTNKALKLNVDLDIDVQFGLDYSNVH